MNRSQKRSLMKSAKKRSVVKPSIMELLFQMRNRGIEPSVIKDGDKVMLNMKAIRSHPDFEILAKEYVQFVESNADTVFTAMVESGKYDKGFITLKEDGSGWLFWPGDVIKVSN